MASKEDRAGVDENAPVAKPALDNCCGDPDVHPPDRRLGRNRQARRARRPRGRREDGHHRELRRRLFVGYTPQLAVAVWVGYPKELKPMLTEFEGGPRAGGTFPAEI